MNMTTTTESRWVFNGDVNLEYGGSFIDLSTWHWGYCSAVRVTDLDSGCGFTGAVMIEHVVINGTDDSKRIRQAMDSYGSYYGNRHSSIDPTRHKENLRLVIAESLMSYGYSDQDDGWDGYGSHHTEILQLESDGPMVFDGWKADKRITNTTLEDYVRSVHLKE